MDIRLVSTKGEWDNFIAKVSYTTMFLSWEWSLFENSLGNTFKPYGIYVDNYLVGLLPIKYVNAKRGKYLHLRHGPILDWQDRELVNAALSFIKTEVKKGFYFARISPLLSDTVEHNNLLHSYGLTPSPVHSSDAERTLVIDLTKPEDQLLSEMRKTTRNLIRKSQKMNITIEVFKDLSRLDVFLQIYLDTVNRHRWTAYSQNYIRKEYEIFAKEGKAYTFVAYYEDKPISSSIFITHEKQVIYHHSGSLTAFQDIPSAYLLHWEAIKFFKANGFTLYNLWGVSPLDAPKHPWYGLSLFKRGFSKQELNFVHAHDLIVNPLANLTRFYEYIEKKGRGY